MSAVFAPASGKGRMTPNPQTIQKMLDENAKLIEAITDYQNKGKPQESFRYQESLHRNLVYLASIAETSPNINALLPPPQSFMHPPSVPPLNQQQPPPPVSQSMLPPPVPPSPSHPPHPQQAPHPPGPMVNGTGQHQPPPVSSSASRGPSPSSTSSSSELINSRVTSPQTSGPAVSHQPSPPNPNMGPKHEYPPGAPNGPPQNVSVSGPNPPLHQNSYSHSSGMGHGGPSGPPVTSSRQVPPSSSSYGSMMPPPPPPPPAVGPAPAPQAYPAGNPYSGYSGNQPQYNNQGYGSQTSGYGNYGGYSGQAAPGPTPSQTQGGYPPSGQYGNQYQNQYQNQGGFGPSTGGPAAGQSQQWYPPPAPQAAPYVAPPTPPHTPQSQAPPVPNPQGYSGYSGAAYGQTGYGQPNYGGASGYGPSTAGVPSTPGYGPSGAPPPPPVGQQVPQRPSYTQGGYGSHYGPRGQQMGPYGTPGYDQTSGGQGYQGYPSQN